jgi:hypothetical protein
MNALLVSDTHFTALPRDAYRWKLFEWLAEAIPKNEVRNLFILGDLTQEKDRHPSQLVNRIVTSLLNLYRQAGLHGIYILRGNHDGLDPTCPFFRFLGEYPSIKYIATPFAFSLHGRDILMLPHTIDPVADWKDVDMGHADTVLMHATVRGAIAENGQALDGIPPGLLHAARRANIYSGDIHVPQKIGNVEYVGAPYPVRFGDSFQPRAILLTGKGSVSLPIPSIRRGVMTLTHFDSVVDWEGVSPGDQFKFKLRLAPTEYMHWAEMKKQIVMICKAKGVELCGLELEKVVSEQKLKPRSKGPTNAQVGRTPKQLVEAHCAANKLPAAFLQAGVGLLKEPQ